MKNRIRSTLIKRIGYLVLLLLQGFSFAFLWYSYYVPLMQERNRDFYFWGNIAVVALYMLFIVFFTKSFDGYKYAILRNKNTCFSNMLAVTFSNIVGNIQIWAVGSQYFSVVPMVILTIVQWIFVVIVISTMRFLSLKVLKPEEILLIYGSFPPDELLEKASKIQDKLLIKKVLNIDAGMEVLKAEIMNYSAVLLCDLDSEKRNQILKFCYHHKKKVYITPKITDIIVSSGEVLPFFDTPLLRINESGLSVESQILKRAFDLIISLSAIIILSPLMLFLAMLIKLQDGGKVFYMQERLTKGGKSFYIIKFRSMRENSEVEGARLATCDDDRITSVGRIMRATHLDELPQIFNIIKGEMSLVGPRPERQEIMEEYEKSIPEFRYRLTVKAGLTGYAQIYGKYNTSPYDKLRLDLKYIETYSLWLDIKLLFLTFKIMFQRDNTEGVKENQKTAMKDD